MSLRVGIAALALLAGVCFSPAAELPCASAESMDHLMNVWTAGFTAFTELAGGAPRLVPVATGSRATKGGTHAIVIFVNEKNPLARISLAQLREIFACDGRITTWGQLGLTGEWATRRISLHGMRVRRETGNPPGIVNFLETRLLAGRAWRDDLHQYTDEPGGAQSLEQITRAVAADEAAIGCSGFAYAVPGVKALALGETDAGPFCSGTAEEVAQRRYPLARTIYLGTGPKPDAVTREFLRYVLGREGQGVIAADAQGFFPLPAPSLAAYAPQPVDFPRTASYVTPAGAIAIVGYNDMQGIIEALDARFAAAHPGFKFALTLKGTKTAPPALARGESAFAPMGAEFTPDQLADYLAVAGRPPLVFRVAHDSVGDKALSGPLAIIVHKDNPLATLTLAQVGEIFSGRATGGLHPCGLNPELALGIFLRERLALGGTFGAGFKGFKQSAEVVSCVAGDSLAIGFAAVNRVTPGVKVLALAPDDRSAPVALTEENIRAGRYPLDRFLLIYARDPLDPFVREYLRFVLSREGQEAIAADALGYLPLNASEVAAELAKLN